MLKRAKILVRKFLHYLVVWFRRCLLYWKNNKVKDKVYFLEDGFYYVVIFRDLNEIKCPTNIKLPAIIRIMAVLKFTDLGFIDMREVTLLPSKNYNSLKEIDNGISLSINKFFNNYNTGSLQSISLVVYKKNG